MQLWLYCTLLVFAAGGCLAQRPRPCRSPPLLEGSFSVVTQNGAYSAYGKYAYDAFFQRIRLGELINTNNKTLIKDVLLLFQEHVMYLIDHKNKTCQKQKLTSQFHPMKIPCNSTFLGQVVIGSLSAPGEGLLVNSWTKETPEDQGQYVLTFTEFGCLPVTVLFNSPKTGWVVTNYFNNIRGIKDPALFIPPPFCKNASLETETEGNFFSAFF
ncbi:ependymin-like 1 [Tachysurus fulvidraco]|uniref:ependymin-like 1 n=1 Tax=Tachysurus fulvidraco TaxID=1234273 RepID=UPI000F4FBA8A|nr:ependymin-like 1 [Tachysurus fulvidraco]